MKIFLVGLLVLGSLSAVAGDLSCYVNNLEGKHIELYASGAENAVDTGAPFGVVTIHKVKKSYQVSSIIDGVETIYTVEKKSLSVTKQKALGFSHDRNATLGNLVCEK